jgi:phospholipid/cholesterol/gamma-HCH transport system ATP-binding protein
MKKIVAEVVHLQKSFGTNEVIKDISFTIAQGENLAILGKSGCGKSVLIKCLVGLIEPNDGSVIMLGQNIAEINLDELNVLRKKIGFLFQSAALYDSMTVRENLEFPLRDSKTINQEEMDALVLEALENVGLESSIDKMPSELSGGMKKRLGLARTLILKPEIILYDEPTTGLDPITSKEISELIISVQKKYNTAAIIITHDLECAKLTSDRIIIINEGTTVAEGTYKELSTSKDEWVQSFFLTK